MLQNGLADGVVPGELDRRLIQQLSQILDSHEIRQDLLGCLGIYSPIFLQLFPHDPYHGLPDDPIHVLRFLPEIADLPYKGRICGVQAEKFSPLQALHQNTHHLPRQLHELLDHGNGSHLIEILQLRVLDLGMPLGDQKDPLIPHHSFLHRRHGLGTVYVKMLYHAGKNGNPPQGKDRHCDNSFFHLRISPLVSLCINEGRCPPFKIHPPVCSGLKTYHLRQLFETAAHFYITLTRSPRPYFPLAGGRPGTCGQAPGERPGTQAPAFPSYPPPPW